jgi:hypothetical protein
MIALRQFADPLVALLIPQDSIASNRANLRREPNEVDR